MVIMAQDLHLIVCSLIAVAKKGAGAVLRFVTLDSDKVSISLLDPSWHMSAITGAQLTEATVEVRGPSEALFERRNLRVTHSDGYPFGLAIDFLPSSVHRANLSCRMYARVLNNLQDTTQGAICGPMVTI